MNTGGNLHNYESYLSKNEEDNSKKTDLNPFSSKKDKSYDRAFEDVF